MKMIPYPLYVWLTLSVMSSTLQQGFGSLSHGIEIPGITACGSAELHNKYRRFHKDTPDIDGSNDLVNLAQECASRIIEDGNRTCGLGDDYGVNIGLFPEISRHSHLDKLVALWYKELEHIIFNEKGYENLRYNMSKIANGTQMIWRSTEKVGCAALTHPGRDQASVYVCLYQPRGNYLEEVSDILLNLKPRYTMNEMESELGACKDEYPEECEAIRRRKAEHICFFKVAGYKGKVLEYCKRTCGVCQ